MDKMQKDPNNRKCKLFFPLKNRDGNQVLSLLKQKLLVYTSVSIFYLSSICFNSHLKNEQILDNGIWIFLQTLKLIKENMPCDMKMERNLRAESLFCSLIGLSII